MDVTLLVDGGNRLATMVDPGLLDHLAAVMADGRDEVLVFATDAGSITIRTRAIMGFIL